MIIGRGEWKEGDGPVLILGMSHENIARLLKGEPILLSRETHGDGIPDGWKIFILVGKTEEDLAKMLKPAIDDQTQIFRDPRL